MPCIYTEQELIAKIKELDIRLDKSIQSSKLDTNQASQSFSIMTNDIKRQRDYYIRLYTQCYGELKPTFLIAEVC